MFAVTLRIQEWSCGPEGDHRSGLPTITACVVRGSENAKAYAVRLKAHMLGAMADEAADLDGMGWAVRMGSHTWDGPGGGQGGEDIEDIDWDARLKGYECTVAKLCSETSMLDTLWPFARASQYFPSSSSDVVGLALFNRMRATSATAAAASVERSVLTDHCRALGAH